MSIRLVCNLCGADVRVCECFDPEDPHPDYTPYYDEDGTALTMRVIADTEKALAVTLRREFPDLLPSTDAWRPITKRCCDLMLQAIRSKTQ